MITITGCHQCQYVNKQWFRVCCFSEYCAAADVYSFGDSKYLYVGTAVGVCIGLGICGCIGNE